MIKYTTKQGNKIEIELEGRTVKDLTVNDIEVVKGNKNSDIVFISTFDNTIVLNSSTAYKKLGCTSVTRVVANDELITLFKKEVQKDIDKRNAERERIINITRENNKKKGISEEQFATTFDKHMTQK